MGLIKANTAPPAAALFSMADIEQQARMILSRARAEADQIVAQAKQQAEQLRAAATKEGRAAGVDQGRKEGHKQGYDQATQQGKAAALNEQRTKLTETFNMLAAAAAELNDRVERANDALVRDELLRLALAIARRVTKAAAATEPAVVEANVREAVRLTMDKSSVRISVNPTQRASLDALLPQLKLAWPTLKHVELIEDASVGMGGCRVASATGDVDAEIDAQLDRIAAELCPSPKS